MATLLVMEHQVVKKRAVSPGELELITTGGLQFLAGFALLFGSPRVLAGNGTALLTAASHPDISYYVKTFWALFFFYAGYLALRAIRKPSIKNRRVAWQVIIPLWACWTTGLAFPLFIGQQTNVIVLGMAVTLVTQWIITRLFVSPNSDWYNREITKPRFRE